MGLATVGYTTGHGEAIDLRREAHEDIGAILRDERLDVLEVPDAFDDAKLGLISALILGALAHPLSAAEFAALGRFVASGGRLLAIPHPMLADWRPRAVRGKQLLSRFLPHHGGASSFLAGLSYSIVRPDEPPSRSSAPQHETAESYRRFMSPGDLLYRIDGAGTGQDPADPSLLRRVEYGRGVALLFGTRGRLSAQALPDLLAIWLPDFYANETARRMRGPQRHRLLHAYPMRARMERVDEAHRERHDYHISVLDPGRSLLVGVLPHPFCNPAVKGCGFCTFPNQLQGANKATAVVAAVVRELGKADAILRGRQMPRRAVEALYFGGATANLTPPGPFADLCRAVSGTFDLTDAEISLEGVPAYFLRGEPRLLDVLRRELPARHYRLSMGVQTLDPDRLTAMGRRAFGDAATFRQVVKYAHAEGATISGDFLFNLPGQTLAEMRDDAARAVDLGLDQICLYHLVLFDGLNVEWAKDRALLDSLPSNERAAEHWMDLRDCLIGRGYRQTTLTNFERSDLVGTACGYRYEIKAKCPETHDLLGFGPAGLSITSRRGTPGWFRKVCNPERAGEYLRAVERPGMPIELYFHYEGLDARILHLTRKVATLAIDRALYRSQFDADPMDDFPGEFAALTGAGLIEPRPEALRLTPRGMFYADTIAGLLAWRRVRKVRIEAIVNKHWLRRRRELREREGDAAGYRMG